MRRNDHLGVGRIGLVDDGHPAAKTVLSAVLDHGFDVGRGKVVLFGGHDQATNATLDDTWEYDGVRWAQIFPPAVPVPQMLSSSTYDAVRQQEERHLLRGGRGVRHGALLGRHLL